MALRTPAFNDAKTYGFEWLRYIAESGDVQEGVVSAGDLKVTAAAGGGMRVDIAAGAAFIKGDSGVAALGITQGLFTLVNDAAVANAVTLNASDATNPRLDQICLRVRDSSDLGTAADDGTFLVVTGVPTAAATLANRNGAANLPADHVRLADVLVPAGSVATSAGNIADRRPWARGIQRRLVRPGGSVATAATTAALLDSANWNPPLECSGVPLRISLRGRLAAAAALTLELFPWVDGAAIDGMTSGNGPFPFTYASGGLSYAGALSWETVPAAPAAGGTAAQTGRHNVGWAGIVNASTATLSSASGVGPVLLVEELVRQNADNT